MESWGTGMHVLTDIAVAVECRVFTARALYGCQLLASPYST